jgi:hypothetical protein
MRDDVRWLKLASSILRSADESESGGLSAPNSAVSANAFIDQNTTSVAICSSTVLVQCFSLQPGDLESWLIYVQRGKEIQSTFKSSSLLAEFVSSYTYPPAPLANEDPRPSCKIQTNDFLMNKLTCRSRGRIGRRWHPCS